jgi:electron transfer flavoprotein beta subunit
MKILVCISNVPDTTSKINFTENDTLFDSNGVQYVINPNDEFGLTRAIWFQEQQGATVTVATVGLIESENTIRKALAIGANDAIRINVNPTDGFAVAQELAKIVKDGGYDLVICGKESLDYNGGMVPGILASLANYNFVNACIDITIDGNTATAVREIDGGKETVTASLPIVIGGQKGLVEEKDLRIPNMRGIMSARSKTLLVVDSISIANVSTTIKFEKPAPKQAVKIIDANNLDELINLLHTEAKVL